MNIEAAPWVHTWLSRERFTVYVAATGGNVDTALALYEWNAQLSSAFQHDLGHLEVGLRNAYDRALRRAIPPGDPHWLFAPVRYFPPYWLVANNGIRHDANLKARERAGRSCTSLSDDFTSSAIVSHTTSRSSRSLRHVPGTTTCSRSPALSATSSAPTSQRRAPCHRCSTPSHGAVSVTRVRVVPRRHRGEPACSRGPVTGRARCAST